MTVTWLSTHSPIGEITVFEENGALVALDWGWAAPPPRPSALLDRAKAALDAYFDRAVPLPADLPLAATATPFQARLRAAMLAIPFGRTQTYGDLADRLASAPRAVGTGCGANPLPLFVPCHRVLGAGGKLGGYSGGDGAATKRYLLRLEGALA